MQSYLSALDSEKSCNWAVNRLALLNRCNSNEISRWGQQHNSLDRIVPPDPFSLPVLTLFWASRRLARVGCSCGLLRALVSNWIWPMGGISRESESKRRIMLGYWLLWLVSSMWSTGGHLDVSISQFLVTSPACLSHHCRGIFIRSVITALHNPGAWGAVLILADFSKFCPYLGNQSLY